MKSLLLAVISLVAVVVLSTTESCLLSVHAAPRKPYSIAVSLPVTPITVNVKVNGKITIWSDAPGFNSPKVEALQTSAQLVQDPTKGIWFITIANLTIPLSSSTVLTLQNGKHYLCSFLEGSKRRNNA